MALPNVNRAGSSKISIYRIPDSKPICRPALAQPLESELPGPPDRLRRRPDMQNTLESSYLPTRNNITHSSEGASGVLAQTEKESIT